MKNITIAVFAATLFFQANYGMKRELVEKQTKPTHSLLVKYVPGVPLAKKLLFGALFLWLVMPIRTQICEPGDCYYGDECKPGDVYYQHVREDCTLKCVCINGKYSCSGQC